MSPLSVRLGTAVLLGGLASSALAQVPSPIGAWTTIDDETKKPKSIVRITERDGVYTGTVEKLLNPAKADAKCDDCAAGRSAQGQAGAWHGDSDRPLRKEGENVYSGGRILDPNNGKTYDAKVTVVDGGKKLEMRGSVLFIGRTQTWLRAE
jgi:uncharacterized protein (DUF2147 family)